eukprot:13355221-Heterocapsa_arctica.AAC.1
MDRDVQFDTRPTKRRREGHRDSDIEEDSEDSSSSEESFVVQTETEEGEMRRYPFDDAMEEDKKNW